MDFWLPGLVPQSVLVWDGIRIDMERAAKNHVKISLLPEMLELHLNPLHAGFRCARPEPGGGEMERYFREHMA